MQAGVKLLSDGWYRGARPWWQATAVLLAVVSATVLIVVGVFQGMEDAADERISAYFTNDVRITAGEPGAAPDRFFGNETDPVEEMSEFGDAHGRIETTYLLSRRTFLESYQFEDEQFRVQVPGVDAAGEDFYGVGVLIGIDPEDSGVWSDLRPYRLVGAFPQVSPADPKVVPVMMSIDRFAQTLSDAERDAMAWPPTASDLASFDFEVTTARIDTSSPFKDVIRRPAQVVGLFETRLDALDTFAIVVPIQSARDLLGVEPDAPVYNVVTVHTDDRDAAIQGGQARGWGAEGSRDFAQRYVGQLMDVVHGLSVTVATLFYILPVFLLWHGLAQLLDRNEREVAVCRAIGISRQAVRRSVGHVTWKVCSRGLIGAAILMLIAAPLLASTLPSWAGSPIPLAFRVPWWGYGLTLLLIAGSAGASAWFTIRAHERADLTSRLRAA